MRNCQLSIQRETSGSHGGEYEVDCLLTGCAVQSSRMVFSTSTNLNSQFFDSFRQGSYHLCHPDLQNLYKLGPNYGRPEFESGYSAL